MHISFELIFLAALTVWLINKLLSSLGTREDIYGSSYFSNNNISKVITGTARTLEESSSHRQLAKIKPFLRSENERQLLKDLQVLEGKMPTFTFTNFIHSSYEVFKVLVCDNTRLSDEQLNQLIDKGFIKSFNAIAVQRQKVTAEQLTNTKYYLSEIYFFGNRAYIKIEFIIAPDIKEYWTFNKSLNNANPEWVLSNIEVVN